MPSPILIDTNVPIYAAGRPHPLREPCREVIRLVLARPSIFVTDAEVLQELVHRYRALHDWIHGKQVFREFRILLGDRVEPVYADDVQEAARLADRHPGLSARDLIHVAVMARLPTARIVSADRGFDDLSQIERLDPANLADWRSRIDV